MVEEKARMMSMDITQENIKKIQSIFPNAVSEVTDDSGNAKLAIDFEMLKQELSDSIISDKQERYRMGWPDKKNSILLSNSQTTNTLRPLKNKSKNFEETGNIYIEGDNLEALKILRETYLGKISAIYIDPPYNTGNDFIYSDDFAISSDEYIKMSGQIDDSGNKLVANNESNGRFHTDWMNLIYPRLKIAKDLLSDDGVIFISIDDGELNNLIKICDEIFGERNFLANLIVISAPAGTQSSVDFAVQQSYCVAYRKSESFHTAPIPLTEKEIKEKFCDGIDQLGSYYVERLWKRGIGGRMEDVPSLHFPVYFNPKTNEIFVDDEVTQKYIDDNKLVKIIPYQTAGVLGRWTWSREKMKKERDHLSVVKVAGEYKLHKKVYSYEVAGKRPYTIIDSKIGRTELGSLEIKNILGEKVFDYPKYSAFVEYLLQLHPNKNGIFMDFFSGSATTGHAIMNLNAKDGGNRKFILVQLPEKCEEGTEACKAGYKTICDIGEARLSRSCNFLEKNRNDNDCGFRVLKVDSSNMNEVYYNPRALQQNLLEATVDNVKPDRTGIDLLFQVMLECGALLSSKIEEKTINGKTVYCVSDNFLIACYDDDLDEETIKEIAKMQPIYASFKDSSFHNDAANINAEQIFKTYSPNTEKIKVI